MSSEKALLFKMLRANYSTFKSLNQQEALKSNLYLQGVGETIELFMELLDIDDFADIISFLNEKTQHKLNI